LLAYFREPGTYSQGKKRDVNSYDGVYKKNRQPTHVSVKIPTITSMEEIIQLLKEASVIIKKPDPEGI
jgi:hypothetical protein